MAGRRERAVIPPSSRSNVNAMRRPGDTLHVLQERLLSTESDTINLVKQLGDLGFQTSDNARKPPKTFVGEEGARPVVSPFQARNKDTETLLKNYDEVVSRVCRLESTIQSLKLSLCSVQAEHDLAKRGSSTPKNEEIAALEETHEKETKRLKKELARSRRECRDMLDAKNSSEENLRRLTAALEVSTTSKMELVAQLEEAKSSKQKLSKRLAEVKEELSQESSLRSSIEDTHAVLLERIKDLEGVVQVEREEVKTLAQDCTELRKDGVKSKKETIHEKHLRDHMEEMLKTLKAQTEIKDSRITDLQEEIKVLSGSLLAFKNAHDEQKSTSTKERTDLQILLESLKKENRDLHEALKTASTENAHLTAERQDVFQKEQFSMQKTIRELEKDKVNLEIQCEKEKEYRIKAETSNQQMEIEMSKVRDQLLEEKNVADKEKERLAEALEQLKVEIQAVQRDKEAITKAKQSLLDEVNQAVDGMAEERSNLQTHLEEAKMEIVRLQENRTSLEQENADLLDRMGAVELQQAAQKKVEGALSELLESKKRLAYDKGRLETTVSQLQQQLEAMATSTGQLTNLRKVNSALQAKVTKMTAELTTVRTSLQRTEGQLKQVQTSAERKEGDFNMAIKARDEAFREVQRLQSLIEVTEEKERRKVMGFEQSVADARGDCEKMAATLEGVMTSHSQLQVTVEELEVELGRKDSEMAAMKAERHNRQNSMEKLRVEVETLQGRLIAMENLENSEVKPLRSALERSKLEHLKMTSKVEDVLQTNSSLQTMVDKLHSELEQKEYQFSILKDARKQELESNERSIQNYEKQLELLKHQTKSEKDSIRKKTQRDLAELRRVHEETVSRVQELNQSNAQLKQRAADLELQVNRQKERIRSQKAQLDHFHRTRKENQETQDHIKAIREELVTIERAKNEYMAKNAQQATTISSFIGQMTDLQGELKALSESQQRTSQQCRSLEEELERERARKDELTWRYKELKRKTGHLQEEKKSTKIKLLEANADSKQISASLEEAQRWFKDKFEGLQSELARSRHNQESLEKTNQQQQRELLQEKRRAEDTTDNAKHMIRESRRNLKRIAQQTEIANVESKTQLHQLLQQLQAEKERSNYLAQRVEKFLMDS